MNRVVNWKVQITTSNEEDRHEYQVVERVGDHHVCLILSGNYSHDNAVEYLKALNSLVSEFIPLGALPGQEGFVKAVEYQPPALPPEGLSGFKNWELVGATGNGQQWYGIQEQFGPYDVLLHVVGSFGEDNGKAYAERLCHLLNVYAPLGSLPGQAPYIEDVVMFTQRHTHLHKGE